MANQIIDLLLLCHDEGSLTDEEFILLYDLNSLKNLDLPYWKYQRFDINNMEMMNVLQSSDLKKTISLL